MGPMPQGSVVQGSRKQRERKLPTLSCTALIAKSWRNMHVNYTDHCMDDCAKTDLVKHRFSGSGKSEGGAQGQGIDS